MKFKSAIATPRRPDAARNIFNAEAQRTQNNAENNVMSRVVGGLSKNLCAHRVSVVKNPAIEDHRVTMNKEKSLLEFNARTVVREILSPRSRCESLRAPRLRVKTSSPAPATTPARSHRSSRFPFCVSLRSLRPLHPHRPG